ncbi:MAG: hypothetical protein DMG11_30520, partial [Acidobacteria bacterium]
MRFFASNAQNRAFSQTSVSAAFPYRACFQRIQFGYSVAFSCSVAFRIEIAMQGNVKVFILSGQIQKEALAELTNLFELETDYRGIVVDLKEVSLVSREVMRFLARSQTDGVKLENCPPYIREWMS